jgi:hypothetical protein
MPGDFGPKNRSNLSITPHPLRGSKSILRLFVSERPMSPPPGDRPEPLFRPRATALFRAGIGLAVLLVISAAGSAFAYYHSPWWTRVGFAPDQPVLFSHRHHAGELKIDCRFCHTSVETSAFAGMPPTQTCLTCHSQLFTHTAMLQPVVASLAQNTPLRWNRVTAVPAYVYFDHSIHIAKGVGCTTCHGDVGSMALAAKAERLDMRWCVSCHRDPGRALRPREEIFAPSWTPPADQAARGHALLAVYDVDPAHLTNCSTCHR